MLRDFIAYVCYWLRCEGILGHPNYHFRQPCDLGRLSLSWLHTFRFHCSCFRSLSLHKIRFSVGTTELIEVMNCDISCINELNELNGDWIMCRLLHARPSRERKAAEGSNSDRGSKLTVHSLIQFQIVCPLWAMSCVQGCGSALPVCWATHSSPQNQLLYSD